MIGSGPGKKPEPEQVVPTMTSLADRTVSALRQTHDATADLVATLTPEQLHGPSGASDWTVAQVLSHLGSGAEIAGAGLRATIDGTPPPADGFNQGVWDRWNAMTPQEQAEGFVASDAAYVETAEALSEAERESLQIDLGFLPAPVPFATAAGMRLNESLQHWWDVAVAVEPGSVLPDDAAQVLVDHLSGGMSMMLGFISKANRLEPATVVVVDGTGLALAIDEGVSLSDDTDSSTATLTGGPDALVRLIGGRLTPAHTPDSVTVTGNVTLDELRGVFPGY